MGFLDYFFDGHSESQAMTLVGHGMASASLVCVLLPVVKAVGFTSPV